jgi:predicted N-acyltransferase
MAGTLSIRSVTDLGGGEPRAWDSLDHGPSPFLEHGFLRALEVTGSVGDDAGWSPRYLLVERGADAGVGVGAAVERRLVGAVAAYLKRHSYGEFIFDFDWARASLRAGIPYYPKLVVAAPVTPVTGRRILVAPDLAAEERTAVTGLLIDGVRELADAHGCSSIHWLFTTGEEQQLLAGYGFLSRASFQFHWNNDGFACFEDYLARLASRKRKQMRKERARCAAAIDAVELVPGAALTDADLTAMERFYRRNVHGHGGDAYLRPGFFAELHARLPQRLWFARARRGGGTIAGAVYLQTPAGLYGRYWGCDEPIEYLHFEVACYAGMEHCIRHGIPRFEAGAQGEHKLLRGFVPTSTYSSHWIRHPELGRAVAAVLGEEAREVAARMRQLLRFTPFRADARPALAAAAAPQRAGRGTGS